MVYGAASFFLRLHCIISISDIRRNARNGCNCRINLIIRIILINLIKLINHILYINHPCRAKIPAKFTPLRKSEILTFGV